MPQLKKKGSDEGREMDIRVIGHNEGRGTHLIKRADRSQEDYRGSCIRKEKKRDKRQHNDVLTLLSQQNITN